MLSSFLMKAQVGINTENPNSSSTLDIFADNKGVSFPKIALTGRDDVATIPSPKTSLMVYNTNENVSGGKAYYFWNGTRWDFIFHDLNAELIQYAAKYYSFQNLTPYTFSSATQFYGDANHTKGETITANGTWTVLTEATTNISIERDVNNALFTITGMVEANNTSAGGSVLTTIGIFVNDILVDVKPFDLKLVDNCSFRTFKLYGYTENLPVGNHIVKFAVRNRTTGQSGISVTFGGRNPSTSCNNTISNDEARITGAIHISQPFNF